MIVFQLMLGVLSSVAVLVAMVNRNALVGVGIGALAVLYVGSAGFVARSILRTRYYDFRIALTGQPEAGKTVFANLLYDQLMNGNDPDFQFTAESRSAIATYQAIRGITEDEWPPSTTQGSVLQRDGVLRHRRVVVDLEIGDSAGQHWLQLAKAESQDADYLQWVLSAHAIVHVIPADRMVAQAFDSALRSDVEDLRLAAQLMRSVSRDRYVPVPILIVISKMDLLSVPLVDSELLRIFNGPEADAFESTRRLESAGQQNVGELLSSLSQELLGDFRAVSFTYSSAEVVKQLRRIGAHRRPDIAEWVVAGATSGALTPLQRLVGRSRAARRPQ